MNKVTADTVKDLRHRRTDFIHFLELIKENLVLIALKIELERFLSEIYQNFFV